MYQQPFITIMCHKIYSDTNDSTLVLVTLSVSTWLPSVLHTCCFIAHGTRCGLVSSLLTRLLCTVSLLKYWVRLGTPVLYRTFLCSRDSILLFALFLTHSYWVPRNSMMIKIFRWGTYTIVSFLKQRYKYFMAFNFHVYRSHKTLMSGFIITMKTYTCSYVTSTS